MLLRLADRIEADGAAFAKLESDNTGKPLAAALNDEIPAIADTFRFFAGAARVQHGALAGEYLPGYTSMIRRDPIGVVASIAPWNYPLMMAAWKLGAGARGRQHGHLEAFRADAVDGAEARSTAHRDLPQGRRQYHLRPRRKRRRPVGVASRACAWSPSPAMCRRARRFSAWRPAISSAPISNSAARLRSSSSTTPISMRSSPGYAPLASTTPARTARRPAACTPGAKIYDRLVANLSDAVRSLKVGSQGEAGVEMGPLISEEQRTRVAGFVERAAATRHVEITTGGKARAGGGFFFEPTLDRRHAAVRRDRAARGVRARGLGDALYGRRRRGRLGERFRVWSGLIGLDPGCGQGHERGGAAAIRLHLDQHAFHAGERNAAWRFQALRLRQGSIGSTRSRTTPCRGM